MRKVARHRQIERARRSEAPEVGARVEYPVPLPPVSHVEVGRTTREVLVPTGEERWYPATVTAVERIEHRVDPDDVQVTLEPDEGLSLSLAAVFVRRSE